MELFTDSRAVISPAPEGIQLTVYRIDGLERLERQLSLELPGTLSQAKPTVLKRLAALDASSVAAAREAAQGLARALELGIDRYPAIVIDSSVVLYGTHDLADARDRYRQWRQERQP
jgi:integrating conjugative element protein (TIGR03757 family)